MINFNTKNLVIVCYPPFAGGKFLISCLGLSDNCVLQDQELACKQLQKNFSTDDKINYIDDKLQQARDELVWNDLGLGCGQLFGVENDQYLNEYPEIFKNRYHNIVDSLSNSSKHLFFKVAHNTLYLDAYLKVWPNARLIVFKNYQDFIKHRATPRNRELIHQMFDQKFDLALSKMSSDRYFIWDTSSYDSVETFQIEFTKCSNWLDIKPVDIDQILCYYNKWKDTIEFIKTNK